VRGPPPNELTYYTVRLFTGPYLLYSRQIAAHAPHKHTTRTLTLMTEAKFCVLKEE